MRHIFYSLLFSFLVLTCCVDVLRRLQWWRVLLSCILHSPPSPSFSFFFASHLLFPAPSPSVSASSPIRTSHHKLVRGIVLTFGRCPSPHENHNTGTLSAPASQRTSQQPLVSSGDRPLLSLRLRFLHLFKYHFMRFLDLPWVHSILRTSRQPLYWRSTFPGLRLRQPFA